MLSALVRLVRHWSAPLACAVALLGCSSPAKKPASAKSESAANPAVVSAPAGPLYPVTSDTPPLAPREFRAAWVATVANIDWPSKPGLPVAEQKKEAITILDRAQSLGLNAIILQVRPAADALYPSKIEPWSEYLTGKQGTGPKPFYDPLELWIDEAHRRGIELHAWLNPYRARHPSAKSPVAATHIAKKHPNAVKSYGDLLWMDPGEATASNQTLAVVKDLVRRYDLDGIHIDDYFYPYPVKATGAVPKPGESSANVEFPDDRAWLQYQKSGGKLSRADWRRQNVDHLVEKIYEAIHDAKPWVRFGISPFGVGRPDRRPADVTGFSQYDQLYADAELWLEKGWLDYFTPQLYWPITQKGQPYGPLLDYWISQNPKGRHIWPGLFTSSINETPKSWTPEEILNQVALTRTRTAASGHVHFSMIALQQDRRGIASRLATGPYAQPALVPTSPWLGAELPKPPTVSVANESSVKVGLPRGEVLRLLAIWRRYDGEWRFAVQPATQNTVNTAPDAQLGPVRAVVISAIDRLGNESPRTTLSLTVAPKPNAK